jgi:predicted Fe-Mo cluster-binding NifX family protein
MKIAIATDDFERVAGHAGQASRWLVYQHVPPHGLSSARSVELTREQVFHHWQDGEGKVHPLDGVEVLVARSAGDGFLRRMQKRGVDVLLTSETLADAAILKVIAGEALPDPRWDVSLLLCRMRDLFSRY